MILPIGSSCNVASVLKELGIRKCSYPFDWTLCNIEDIN